MKRAVLALPVLAALAAFVVPAALSASSSAVGVCELMTPARMLEHPALAHDFAEALRSGDAAEVARVRALMGEIRTAHGCEGEIALPEAPREEPALPPGHPPIDGRHAPSSAPFIEAPTTFHI